MRTPELMHIDQEIKQRKIAVLIPTYNNQGTLERVLNGVLAYTSSIIVVNDGSTDATSRLLATYKDRIVLLEHTKNKGKGAALAWGFQKAKECGYNYVLTIDSDGQHYPSDIPVFLEALQQSDTEKGPLLIGTRNMTQESVPKRSSFGNRFSNFWFWIETGIRLTDTQSGFRLYPLHHIPKIYYTNRFEFEIEVIVRTAWRGITVKNVPIQVLYDPAERVSHFRPFRDFVRISVLNTFLVMIALLYIIPRNFVLGFKKKKFKTFLKEDILGSQDSPTVLACSIALGLFIGLTPLWGLHSFLAVFLAVTFRLNKPLAFAFSNISIPPMIPLIIYASIQIGYMMMPNAHLNHEGITYDLSSITQHLGQYIIGSFSLALITSLSVGGLSYVLLTRLKKNR